MEKKLRTLDEVLKELKEAEKEYTSKCKKYGIIEPKEKKDNNESSKIEEIKENASEN